MEVLAAAASVAGILILAGQALSGLRKLASLVEAVKGAPATAKRLLEDIRGLEQTLTGLTSFLQSFSDDGCDNSAVASGLARLEATVKACDQDIQTWLAGGHWKPSRGVFANIKLALQKGYKEGFKEVSAKMVASKGTLALELSLLGRVYDQIAAERRILLESRMQRLEKDIDSMSEQLSSVHSSVSSIASSLSQQFSNEPRSSSTGWDPDAFHWSCDALSGTDDAFDHFAEEGHSECRFCGWEFFWHDDECFVRQGQHLVEVHGFGKCDLGKVYRTGMEFMDHVTGFHDFTLPADDLPLSLFERRNQGVRRPRRGQRQSDSHMPDKPNLAWERPPMNKIRSALCFCINDSAEPSFRQTVRARLCQMDSLCGQAFQDLRLSMCKHLASLDEGSRLFGLDGPFYQQLCYDVACVQEELVVYGATGLFAYERYSCLSQRQIHLLVPSDAPSRRVRTEWVFMYQRLRDDISNVSEKVSFATTGDAWMSQCGDQMSRITLLDLRPGGRGLDLLLRHMSDRLHRHDLVTLGVRSGDRIGPRPLSDISKELGSTLDSEQSLAGRIDQWLFGIFTNSIAMRLMLMSGKALPSLASTEPCAFAASVIQNWADWSQPDSKTGDICNTECRNAENPGKPLRDSDNDTVEVGSGVLRTTGGEPSPMQRHERKVLAGLKKSARENALASYVAQADQEDADECVGPR